MWRAGKPQLSFLTDGVFAGPEYARLGPSLQQYIRAATPIFNVPWGAKTALEAADISGLKELTPSLLRSRFDLPLRLKERFPGSRLCRSPVFAVHLLLQVGDIVIYNPRYKF